LGRGEERGYVSGGKIIRIQRAQTLDISSPEEALVRGDQNARRGGRRLRAGVPEAAGQNGGVGGVQIVLVRKSDARQNVGIEDAE
jgi:hypothetical protein